MKPKLLAIRPSELVILAIHNLGEKSGSSEKEIIRFISRKYGMDEDHLTPRIGAALKRGLNFGILSYRNGRYGLEEVPEPPRPTKDAIPEDERCKTGDEKTSGRKRERSVAEEGISDLFQPEEYQFKKAKGSDEDFSSSRLSLAPGDAEEESCMRMRNVSEFDKRRFKQKKQTKKQDGMQQRSSQRSGGQRSGQRSSGRPAQRSGQRSRKSRPSRCNKKGKSDKSKGKGQKVKKRDGEEGGSGVGALRRSLAKLFGMRSRQNDDSPGPDDGDDRESNSGSIRRKPIGSEKNCTKVCTRTCPNAIRRRQWLARNKNCDGEIKRKKSEEDNRSYQSYDTDL